MIFLTSTELDTYSVADTSVMGVIKSLIYNCYDFLNNHCVVQITPQFSFSLWQLLFYPFCLLILYRVALFILGGKDGGEK